MCDYHVFINKRIFNAFIKPQLAIARLRLHASELFVRLSVCRQNAKKTPKCKKNAIFSKTKQFRATVSINDL